MSSPLRKPEAIGWNAAAVELPQIPTIPAGQDAMSSTISAVLPTLGAQLAANVAALSAKENTFSGKVGAAQAAYASSDDAGSQSVGQIVGMLGQLGQQGMQVGQGGRGASAAADSAQEREPLQRADEDRAEPGERPTESAPVAPPQQPETGDDDVARRV
ncbi:hypothetical protein ABQE44_03510 [Mycolicibacterium sp. XJ2546]